MIRACGLPSDELRDRFRFETAPAPSSLRTIDCLLCFELCRPKEKRVFEKRFKPSHNPLYLAKTSFADLRFDDEALLEIRFVLALVVKCHGQSYKDSEKWLIDQKREKRKRITYFSRKLIHDAVFEHDIESNKIQAERSTEVAETIAYGEPENK